MGYFRFRRSFKILPGVRWNLGKKSSSVSLGGRGFHYTVGSGGERTTVGLPGTGISYTSVNRRKRSDRLPDTAIAEAVAWAKIQTETFHLELPDHTLGELPATPNQIETVHELVQSISGAELTKLGSKQAAFLIDEITREKALFTERKIHEYLDKRQRGSGAGCGLLIAAIVVIGYFLLTSIH